MREGEKQGGRQRERKSEGGTEGGGERERERDRGRDTERERGWARYNRTMYTKYVMNERFSEELIKVSLNHKLEGSHSSNE